MAKIKSRTPANRKVPPQARQADKEPREEPVVADDAQLGKEIQDMVQELGLQRFDQNQSVDDQLPQDSAMGKSKKPGKQNKFKPNQRPQVTEPSAKQVIKPPVKKAPNSDSRPHPSSKPTTSKVFNKKIIFDDDDQGVVKSVSEVTEKTNTRIKFNAEGGVETVLPGSAGHGLLSKDLTSQMLIQPNTKWYSNQAFKELSKASNSSDELLTSKLNPSVESQLYQEAQELIEKDLSLYEAHQKRSSKKQDFGWINSVVTSGTLKDKLAAHVILLQDSPIHNLASVQKLVSLIDPQGRRESLLAMDTLRDLFLGDLLPPDRKLRKFSTMAQIIQANGKLSEQTRNRALVLAFFEDSLKELYTTFVHSLDKLAHDQLDTTRQRVVNTLFELLSSHPEQEQFLLERLVNKLGDTVPKLATHVGHLIKTLCNEKHPAMKSVVVDELERLLFRPNLVQRTQYNTLCVMSEIFFNRHLDSDRLVAAKLMNIYLAFFKAQLKTYSDQENKKKLKAKKKDQDSQNSLNSRIMSALLQAVNRAFPYSRMEATQLEEHINTFYKLIHSVDFKLRIQTLNLIFHILSSSDKGVSLSASGGGDQSSTLPDRFYAVLYRQLIETDFESCKRRGDFLNLVYRACKRDLVLKRVQAFCKRLLTISTQVSAHIAAAILMIIMELATLHPALRNDLTLDKVSAASSSLDYGTKTDGNIQRESDDDDDDEEKYYDVPDSDTEDQSKSEGKKQKRNKKSKNPSDKVASWVHSSNLKAKTPTQDADQKIAESSKASHQSTDYEPLARNPLHANADKAFFSEIVDLLRHFHPSVGLFTQRLTQLERCLQEGRQPETYDGNPLEDFTIMHFLDRFVMRNPKHISKQAGEQSRAKWAFARSKAAQTAGVNWLQEEYLKSDDTSIPIEERFIHSYVTRYKECKKKKADGEDSDDEDVESVASDEFEAAMSKWEQSFGGLGDADFASELSRKAKKDAKEKKKKSSKREDGENGGDEFAKEVFSDDDEELDNEDFADEDMDGSDQDEDDQREDGDDEDDSEVDFANDEEFNDAFDDVDDELDEIFQDDDDDVPVLRTRRHLERGRDKSLASLFASAEEFAELIDKEHGGGDASDDEDDDEKPYSKRSKKGQKRSNSDDDQSDEEDEGPPMAGKGKGPNRRNQHGGGNKGNKKGRAGPAHKFVNPVKRRRNTKNRRVPVDL